jgi:Transglycosylase SLT domain
MWPYPEFNKNGRRLLTLSKGSPLRLHSSRRRSVVNMVKPMMAGKALGRKVTALAVVLAISSGVSQARSQDPSSLCDQAAQLAADGSDVPLEVLLAITRVETGRRSDGQLRPWPWSVNLAGEGFWFADADEAIGFADAQLGSGTQNFDVGCFQINLHWHGAEFASLEDAFDPRVNASYAARFLSELYQTEGNWPDAVAAYHSRTPDKAADYLLKIEAALTDLSSYVPEQAAVEIADVRPRENNFPLLQGGRSSGGASLMPQQNNVRPLIGGVE